VITQFSQWPVFAELKAESGNRPNIVFIMADDMGYGDLGCYNKKSKVSTPDMDRLAGQGMRFLDAHSPSAVCTPTRYGVLTGRYSWRTRLQSGVLLGFSTSLIDKKRTTVASLLKATGFHTGAVGKWHLGFQTHDPSKTEREQKVDYAKPLRRNCSHAEQ
jgi:arylsulfatase A